MRKLLFIISFSVLTLFLSAQNTVHLCVNEKHNFGVPPTTGSIYNWLIQDTLLASIDSGNGTHQILIDLNKAGVFQLLVEEKDVNGCFGYDSILVRVHNLPTPTINALGPTSFCEGDSVLLQVDSAYLNNVWSNGDTLIYTYAFVTDSLFVTVTDTNGCLGSDSIFVDVHPNPTADFIVNGVCIYHPTIFIDNSFISSDSIITKIWHLGDNSIYYGDSVNYSYFTAGDYNVELLVISDFGCRDSIYKTFTIFSKPVADFDHFPYSVSTIEPEMNFNNTSESSSSSLWNMGGDTSGFYIYGTSDTSNSPYYHFEDPGVYDIVLTITDTNQCVDSIIQKIIMYYDFVFFMPNSFTPNNNDELNKAFGPKGLRMDYYQSYQFIVYNKWGGKVFETDAIPEYIDGECVNNCWDGENAPNGVYSWMVIIKDELGAVRKEIGSVTLKR